MSLGQHYGKLPLILPFAEGGERYAAWRKDEDRQEEDRYRLALREKTRKVVLQGGERKLRLVRKLSLTPRPEALGWMISLLDAVSPHLTSLEVKAPSHLGQRNDNPKQYELFDVKLLDAGISCLLLTHVNIGNRSIHYAETIFLISRLAPNMVSLDVNIDQSMEECGGWEEDILPEMPDEPDGDNKLRFLRLAFRDMTFADDVDNLDESRDEHPIPFPEYSPHIRRSSADWVPRGNGRESCDPFVMDRRSSSTSAS